jgi:hypothetical protein
MSSRLCQAALSGLLVAVSAAPSAADQVSPATAIDRPRFMPVKGEIDTAYQHYRGAAVIELVLRLNRYWSVGKNREKTSIPDVPGRNRTQIGGHEPELHL